MYRKSILILICCLLFLTSCGMPGYEPRETVATTKKPTITSTVLVARYFDFANGEKADLEAFLQEENSIPPRMRVHYDAFIPVANTLLTDKGLIGFVGGTFCYHEGDDIDSIERPFTHFTIEDARGTVEKEDDFTIYATVQKESFDGSVKFFLFIKTGGYENGEEAWDNLLTEDLTKVEFSEEWRNKHHEDQGYKKIGNAYYYWVGSNTVPCIGFETDDYFVYIDLPQNAAEYPEWAPYLTLSTAPDAINAMIAAANGETVQ